MDELTDTLVNFGSEIKTVEETADGWKFGGYLVIFNSPDISSMRDRFTKSTDFDFEDGETRTLYYHHGLDGTFGKAKIGKGQLFIKDAGVWLQGEIKKRTDYLEKHVERVAEGMKMTVQAKGIEAPLFGLSSGVPAHLVERKTIDGGNVIEKWSIAEASITPCPAEPMTACVSLKALIEIEEHDAELKAAATRGWQTQPRDDLGRWTDGAGNLNASHVSHVMRSEGIHESHHHDDVQARISSGELRTREQVLKHIDGLHESRKQGAASAAVEPKVAAQQPRQFSEPDRIADKVASHLMRQVGNAQPGSGTLLALAPEGFSRAYGNLEPEEKQQVVKNLAKRGLIPTVMARQKNITPFELETAIEKSAVRLAQEHQLDINNRYTPFSESPIFKQAMEHPFKDKPVAPSASTITAASAGDKPAHWSEATARTPESDKKADAAYRKAKKAVQEIADKQSNPRINTTDWHALQKQRDKHQATIDAALSYAKLPKRESKAWEGPLDDIEEEAAFEDDAIKAGRVLSADNHSEIATACDEVEAALNRLRALLDKHAPESNGATLTPTLAEGGTTKSIDEPGTLNSAAIQRGWKLFVEQQTAMAGLKISDI